MIKVCDGLNYQKYKADILFKIGMEIVLFYC